MALVFLGIGSNLGDRQSHVDRALGLMKEDADLEILAVSALVESEPEGGVDQPTYLNGAIKIKTDLLPLELLSKLKGIERRLGRPKDHAANAPRTMDIDILFYDDVVFQGKNLDIPHPRVATRSFVLAPLAEIAPDLKHPRLQKTVKELHDALTHDSHPKRRGA